MSPIAQPARTLQELRDERLAGDMLRGFDVYRLKR